MTVPELHQCGALARIGAMARPCAYDRTELLRCATALFWERGFAGTSVDDVGRATGVSRSSLYAAFPDISSLFLGALERYLDTVTSTKVKRLAQGATAAVAIRRFLLDIADERPSANAPAHGCLLTNTAVEIGAGEDEIAELVRKAFARLERTLADRLEEAQQQGDLGAETDSKQFARQLMALVQGLRVMTRLRMEPRVARDAVRSALAPLRQEQ